MIRIIIIYCYILVIASSTFINHPYKEGDRYVYLPGDKGVIHLIDLEQTPDPDIKVNPENIKYNLHTRLNPDGEELFLNDDESLAKSHFDTTKFIKILVHGWNGDLDSLSNVLLTSANLNHSDVNVIVVNWNKYASSLTYINSARKVADVGRVLSQFIDFLIRNGASISNFHLVGFSLGAHVVGNAARYTTMGKIPRVTGLDPAGPLFSTSNPDCLQPSDSDYTEVIHTNADYVGSSDRLGHVDFFPNGGRLQPGCFVVNLTCSHRRAVMFYAESIDNEDFMGKRCNDLNDAKKENCSGPEEFPMGGAWVPKFGDGIYHVYTNSQSPFAKK